MNVDIFLTALGLLGAKKSYDYGKAEAARRAELGVFDARQQVNELFLAKSQAISESNRRLEDMQATESTNIAQFSAMGREDRSVEAFLKKSRKTVREDIADLEIASNLASAKYGTAASILNKYGQGAAAGIRAEATVNLISNLSSVLKNINKG
ncbi:MAG: hypothetical protein Tp167SUR398091_10 [Prokaryotic dsDNA virus sp.]|nr:MAG: hypothetical protein Tp167SUR398091_10 [Prokaryotic dsDNA virus sp.]|tara:strand:+ start:8281 stop:8739 length:459 start_codon:yes stop_codon:yes gene_type:complete